MQRATATAAATTTPPPPRPLARSLLLFSGRPPLSPSAESAFAKVCARSLARSAPTSAAASRNRVQTAPCAANRPAWPRRTSEEGEARRPPNENQGKRRTRRNCFSGLGSNRGLFCQCSLVHEVGKSWCERQEKKEKKKTTEGSSSFGRRRGRGLRWGSDTAAPLFP